MIDLYPCLGDDTSTTGFDAHCLYQEAWAARRILSAAPSHHVDVGSRTSFVAVLSAAVPVCFIDIRPLPVKLDGLDCRAGSVLALPFGDASVNSLSCLHVVEHVGLGRYGDPLDPEGTRKAARELCRVLAPGGRLYLSLPIGRPRVMFNAHRVHDVRTIVDYFSDLSLVEFSGVDDHGACSFSRQLESLDACDYACGFFLFRKP